MHLLQIALLSLQAAICSMHSADLTLEKAFQKMSLGLEMAQQQTVYLNCSADFQPNFILCFPEAFI